MVNYKKQKLLGEGGMGEVWLVAHPETRMLYAAKLLKEDLSRPKDVERFKRECQVLLDLDHENIIKAYEYTEIGPLRGYIMEYCPDGSLESRLPITSDDEILEVITSLLKAVEYIHQKGLIHRDIKPMNILFAPDGTLRLSDFGLVIKTDPERTVLTTSNWVSQGFAPPEQFFNMATVTQTADIYSIGAVLFYLVFGKTFRFDLPLEVQVRCHSLLFEHIFLLTLQHSPENRAQSTDNLLAVLSDFEQYHSTVSLTLNKFFSMTTDEKIGKLNELKVALDSEEVPINMANLPLEIALGEYDFVDKVVEYERTESVLVLAFALRASLAERMRALLSVVVTDYVPRALKNGYRGSVRARLNKLTS